MLSPLFAMTGPQGDELPETDKFALGAFRSHDPKYGVANYKALQPATQKILQNLAWIAFIRNDDFSYLTLIHNASDGQFDPQLNSPPALAETIEEIQKLWPANMEEPYDLTLSHFMKVEQPKGIPLDPYTKPQV